MKSKLQNSSLTLLACVALAACGGGQGGAAKSEAVVAETAKARAEASPAKDSSEVSLKEMGLQIAKGTHLDFSNEPMDSPDNAVKAWWKWWDAREALGEKFCIVRNEAFQEAEKTTLMRVVTADAASRLGSSTSVCKRDTFRRTIDEVKKESETRAIVFATIYNAAEPPPGTEESVLQEAKKGRKFKYVVERVDGRWLIADVLARSLVARENEDLWDRLYRERTGRHFSGTIFMQ